MHRRAILKMLALAAALAPRSLRAAKLPDPPAGGFDYAWLKGQARARAAEDHAPIPTDLPGSRQGLDYDHFQAIHFLPERSLWRGEQRGIELRYFHRGFLFKRPVYLFEVVAGTARAIDYDPANFDLSASGLDPATLTSDLGYAGLRIIDETNPAIDVAAFLGASYFRAVGVDKQYGLSARGLAIDSGMVKPEEFPFFSHFWCEQPALGAGRVVIYAMLDSPRCAGAYRFEIAPGENLVMDVDAAVYPRSAIERLGIAPLTSMYQSGENDRRQAHDIRPEIHDSDGLALWTGSGEWIWRPLENPRDVRFNYYADNAPRGFGLLQRDRNFDHYQDDSVFYERRPSLWVEPKGDWGPGGVALLELPGHDETADNIVAFWQPAQPVQPGTELLFAYRLHWGRRPPVAPNLATVVATRTGLGGIVASPRKYFSWRFAIDFAGGKLPMVAAGAKVELMLEASRGTLELTSARPLTAISGYRALFDLRPDDSVLPINLKATLAFNGVPLSETWFYQYSPPPLAERSF